MKRNMTPYSAWPALVRLAILSLAVSLVTACGPPPEPTINLYRAIHAGDLDQIKRHLHWGTDIDQAGADGDFPLHVAAKRGHVVVVEELLKHGAAADVTDANGHTPLQAALMAGKAQSARVLLRHGVKDDPQTLLLLLVEGGISDRDALGFLVAKGADVNAADEGGVRPLHRAVTSGQVLVVKRLIALGAEVNVTDVGGRTPLAMANAGGRRDIAALLQSFGAHSSPDTLKP